MMSGRKIQWACVNVCRMVVALTFILSGFVKAVDPLGTQYKIHDYLAAAGMADIVPDVVTLGLSVLLAAVEFSMGVFLLFAIHRRTVSRLMLAFMVVMTPLTLWLALTDPVKDCGCFGDAVVLTNWETFAKNVVLLVCTFVIFRRPMMMVRFISKTNQWIILNYTVLFILVSSVYCLYYLPVLDFRPYHVGADIKKGMEIPDGAEQPQFETTFILEKNGTRKEFTVDNYPDSTWTFVDSKTVQTAAGYVPEIHDFYMQTLDGEEDVTDKILDEEGYTFLLISPHIEQADDLNFGDIDVIYEYCMDHGYSFRCLTASNEDAIQRWRDITGAEYEFLHADETTLKTVIRSNPGLMLLKHGVVLWKWSHNDLPDLDENAPRLEDTVYGTVKQESFTETVTEIVLWFMLPLLLLTFADRMWAWTGWLRKKKNSNKRYQRLNKKNMRKKIVAGNWKMNMNLQEGVALAKELNEALTADKPNCDVIICTPFIHLASVAQILDKDVIGLGAENCADKEKGAYTGEVSAEMVKSTGAQYVILGHSERRGYYGETSEILKEKTLLALKNGLKVIFCIGESLEEREANKQNEVVKAELEGSVFNLTAEEFKNIVIAYEPIWAIGTGKTATSEQAEEIHAYIRSIIAEKYGEDVANETSILYGGSCKASNAPELFAKEDIDGGLIGGASLKATDFKGIIDAWK
ncbi:triose-phosphate isomerase [Prevotella sp. PCHR]|uniref:Triosephosphate isomerase n=1 Tax=Xylanibacter caecicola TaxID=2736294 RepID=A0ABX2B497_9BACT|nr:BT_3928 family protein [Xylanibacter caecicola]NPE25293.1 triose-phosphate isomerase [Xylanibacter caecicola]